MKIGLCLLIIHYHTQKEREREREKEMWLVQLVNKPEDIIDSYALCVIIIYINNNLDNFNMWIFKYALSDWGAKGVQVV